MRLSNRNRDPLYRQVADEVRGRIASGEWLPDQPLPSEPALAQAFAVSRATVREALRLLEHEGVVQAVRGQGTFVRSAAPAPHIGLDTLYSITDIIRHQGYEPGITDVTVRPDLLRKAFSDPLYQGDSEVPLPPDEPVAIIERTRLADGRPVAYTCDAIPLRLLGDGDWESQLRFGVSLFHILKVRGIELVHTSTRVYGTGATAEAARRLEVRQGSPLLMTREVVFDRTGEPVVLSVDFYRSDRLQVMVRRIRTRTPGSV